ncbi:MAG TPA: hypothetical protein V6C65_02480 [Allocoleopsis sp.]
MSSIVSRIQTGLTSLFSKPTPPPLINSYGQQESGIAMETIQQVMEWLFGSLFHAGYFGQSHLFWLPVEVAPETKRQLQKLHCKGEPVLGYRCGNRTPEPPTGYYWRLMPEHPSLRVYQLEVKEP